MSPELSTELTGDASARVALQWPRRLLAGLAGSGPSLAEHHRLWGQLPALSPADVLSAVERSGLLGRGGAGYPTGRKMRTVAAARRRTVVVANGAEGEPASAKDRLLLTRAPHLVLDGIQLAGRAVHADRGYLVVHDSAVLDAVDAAMRERSDPIPVEVGRLPAPYVSSEETAVVHWLNGGEAKPTFTPPRPFEAGVGRRPTLLNNVETLAHVATIARRGAAWFRDVGDPDEPGTLLVTVHGPDGRQRITEVATGTSIGRVLERAGWAPGSSDAVLVGGYFGTWLPGSLAEQLPLTHRALRAVGGALGAGVLAPLPRDRCGLTETARVASYLAANNAGQCGPCLNGLPAIADALRALAVGGWDDRRWGALERHMAVVPGRGACRHPDGAVRLVSTALTVFAADVAAHRFGPPCAASRNGAWLPVPSTPAHELVWK